MSPSKRLDRSRAYGIVTGHAEARYEQDGALFRTDGTAIDGQSSAPDDSHARIIAMANAGMIASDIAVALSVARSTVSRALQKAKAAGVLLAAPTSGRGRNQHTQHPPH